MHIRALVGVVSALLLFTGAGFILYPGIFDGLKVKFLGFEEAFSMGEKYFDHSQTYDINRAEFFYTHATNGSSVAPYAYHQLARIAFLRGDFDVALKHINTELATNPDQSPSSYYIRALILAYKGDYAAASEDYVYYTTQYPANWAAANDHAWVLLQQGKFADAAVVTSRGLAHHPTNPWLLNTNAIALYEMGLIDAARDQMQRASLAAQYLREEDWLNAYPGNDPLIAADGIRSFQDSVVHNMHMIAVAAHRIPYNGE